MWVYVIEGFRFPFEDKHLVKAVHDAAEYFGLYKTLEQMRPSRSHWHWKREGLNGTLEVTWEDDKHQLLVIVHQNRAGQDNWAKKLAPKFAQELALGLDGKVTNHHVTHGH